MRWEVLIVVTLVAGALQTGAAEPEECDNRAFLRSVLPGTETDGNGGPLVDAAVAELAAHVGDVCLADVTSETEDTGGFPVASDHIMIFEVTVIGIQQETLCNQGAEGGPGAHPSQHYEAAVRVPPEAEGQMPWSYGAPEHAGVAYSEFTDAKGPVVHSEAYLIDLTTGKSFAYDHPIAYAGVSDFFCYVYHDGFTHYTYNFNIPFLTGAVSSSIVEP